MDALRALMAATTAASGSGPRRSTRATPSRQTASASESSREAAPPRKERRKVEYEPHTYAEYQVVCQPGKWEQLGRLGPDLQDDEIIEKKAQKERVKEYSRNLRAQNAQSVDYMKHMRQMEQEEPKPAAKEPTKREKMAKYAANVPKPKTKKKATVIDDGFENVPMSALEELEAKHRQDQLAVAQIRKEMAMPARWDTGFKKFLKLERIS